MTVTSGRTGSVVAVVIAAAVGAVVAFLTAGPALFADGAMGERLLTLAITLVLYAVLGLAFGAALPRAWKWTAIALSLPVVPVVVLFGEDVFSSAANAGLVAGFLLGVPAAALSGALLGMRLRTRSL